MMWQLQHQLPSQYHICPVSTASLHESQVHQTTSKHVVACDTTWAIGWAMNGVSVLLHSVTVQLTALKCLFFNLCRLVLHVAVPHVVSNCIAMHQLLSRAQLTRHHSYKIIAGSQRHFSDCVWQSVHGFPMFFLTNYKCAPQSKSTPLALLQFPMGIAAWASQQWSTAWRQHLEKPSVGHTPQH